MVDLALRQRLDDCLIEANLIEGEAKYRRRRSLKFRQKMRARRQKLFKDRLHRPDRTVKNENKIVAAKRRKRDDLGKFNLESEDSAF